MEDYFDIEEAHVGHIEPTHRRHEGFRFLDKITGLWHSVESLEPHPDDPTKQIGSLTYEDTAGPVAEPEEVIIEPGELHEGREYKKLIVGAGAVVLAVSVATGTLIIRRKRRS